MLIIFVCVAIAIVAIVFVALNPPKKKAMVRNLNPIDGIRPNGVMGFEIGDSYAFCLSRFHHLSIRVNDDELAAGGAKSGFIVFGRNEYNNIKEVRCRFEEGHLFSITIDVDYSKGGIRDMYGILMSRICRLLAEEPSYEEMKKAIWRYANTEIILLRHIVPILEEEKLLVQVTFA